MDPSTLLCERPHLFTFLDDVSLCVKATCFHSVRLDLNHERAIPLIQ